ncbi:hypothetical protein [Streptomyces exfoliatus]|uniref:hypothetical protein n=1 Tax=Streptomyces exfoliatus TaxID=1905 RepID=UPI0037A6B8F8
MNKPDCDFCNLAGTARWRYVLADDRPVVGLGDEAGTRGYFVDDNGVWHACVGCALLVDRKDMPKLVARVTRSLSGHLPMLRDADLRETWQAFMTARYAVVMSPATVKIPL